MTGRDRQSDDFHGLVRGSRGGETQQLTSVHPVRMEETGQRPSVRTSDDDRWTIRPKSPGSDLDRAQTNGLKAADIVDPAFIHGRRLHAMPADQAEKRSKRWFALGLAGMVYVMGIAGLWSIYRTFGDVTISPLTPAGSAEPSAPLNEPVDLRDAELIEERPSTSG